MPHWYDFALEANQTGSNIALNELKRLKIHASETAWVGTEFDYVVENNGTIDELFQKIKSIVSDEITLSPSDSFFSKNLSTVTTDSF